jgi:shikimate kinase/3-dehydroquinate synthase
MSWRWTMFPGASSNLTLTGFMGTGKTAVAQEIARRTGREFVDMDAVIEAREGMPVGEIFRQKGEAHFRRLEAALCRELAARSGVQAGSSQRATSQSAATGYPEAAIGEEGPVLPVLSESEGSEVKGSDAQGRCAEARGKGLVIATGGGALIPDLNREILIGSGPVVCLTASVDEILRRLDAARDRPLLDVPDRRARIATLLDERAEAYRRIPLQVDTTDLPVAAVADRVLSAAASLSSTVIPVRHPGGAYAIHLGGGLLAQVGVRLRAQGLGGPIALVTNPTVGHLYAKPVVQSLEAAGYAVTPCMVPDGEAYKTLDTVRALYDDFVEAGLDRRGTVLALGGGVVGDMAGFVAATYLRGVALVQVPTTLLAMVDASVGGKAAVDHPRGKNLIGAFKQPALVLADPDTLATLPAAELATGLAEVVKAGLIGDPVLWEQIERYGPAPLPWLVERALRVKVAIVEEDPYERGRRAVLNLGHTVGHALELLSGYDLPHGSAVSVGLVAAARLSAHRGLCDDGLPVRVEGVLARLGLPTTYRGFTPDQIWRAMATDKKRRGTRRRFVLLRAIGDVLVTDQVTREDITEVLEALRSA